MLAIGYLLLSVAVAWMYWFLLPRARFVRPAAQFSLDAGEQARARGERVSLSLLMPLKNERHIAEPVQRILQSDHSDYEILLIVDRSDHQIEAARRVAEEHPDRVRLMLTDESSTKAAALNFAIPHCRGDVIGVIGGDIFIALGLLSAVEAAFLTTRIDVVSAGVQLSSRQSPTNFRESLDRTSHTKGTRPLRTVRHFYPIAGGVYFIRADLLRLLGGWDDDCQVEATEVALRLSSYGAVCGFLYGPDAWADSYGAGSSTVLHKARQRRYAGLLKIYSTGEWRRFPSVRDRRAARRALLMPVVRAMAGPWLTAIALACFMAGSVVEPQPGRAVWEAAVLLRFCGVIGVLMSLVAMAMDVQALMWQFRNSSRFRPDAAEMMGFLVRWWVFTLSDSFTATQVVWWHLRSSSRVLTGHFERSKEEPDRPDARFSAQGEGAGGGSGDTDVPPDLLSLAQNPDLPAAAATMAEGLDRLFRALGPPPDSLRLDGTGPRPRGGGGVSGD
ncbi:glycosyltransferase [Streptomyces sp. Amel2xC10]|uniref:glycosyltransferase family 2 protein n=1 Tax=Streptomyces sp. Amel2xC10 TaxID=1305826 RepID=UPI0015C4E290|nr:glycosyltransferase [Streptomyces sp. Amel2xC10]